jgi:xylulokinase
MPLVAGVDSSTQSCKVTVRDADTGLEARSGRASHPDGTEVDPRAWWDALLVATADAGGLDGVAAISIGGQQHGMVVLDEDGRVVRDALLWNDTRSGQAAADLVDELGAEAWAERVGLVPVASFTATKLRWLRDTEPGNAERVRAVALPHDWLSWRLRGYGPADESPLGPDLEALATDGSDASGTGYWDPRRREYDAELFMLAFGRPMRVAGADGDPDGIVVPRVVAPDAAMGPVEEDVRADGVTVFPRGLVVAPGAGDNAAAALGLGLGDGDVAVSLGTSGTVFGVTEQAVSDPSGTVAGFADAAGARLPIVTTLNAARVLEVVGSLLDVDHAELGRLALEVPPGSDGLVLVPYFVGERTPNLPDATASLVGLTPTTTSRTHLARAAFEGMLCSLADGLAALEAIGLSIGRVLLIGGAAQNDAVRAIAPQVFGRDVVVPDAGEYVARGAAAQAVRALGVARPTWELPGIVLPADPRPAVLEEYRRHRPGANRG